VMVMRDGSTRVAIHRGGPDGITGSEWWSIVAAGAELLALQAALGDVDGDGLGDFAISRVTYGAVGMPPSLVEVDVYRGGATAPALFFTIVEPARSFPGDWSAGFHGFAGVTGNGPARTTAGDLDGDGLADVIVPDSRYRDATPAGCAPCPTAGRVYVYPGRASATPPTPSAVLRGGWNAIHAAVADFDADGYDDLVWRDQESGGDPSPAPSALQIHYGAPGGASDATHVVLPVPPGSDDALVFFDFATGDFDRDGAADLASHLWHLDAAAPATSWVQLLVYPGGARAYWLTRIDLPGTQPGGLYGSWPGIWR
jgi:hypothetical protein